MQIPITRGSGENGRVNWIQDQYSLQKHLWNVIDGVSRCQANYYRPFIKLLSIRFLPHQRTSRISLPAMQPPRILFFCLWSLALLAPWNVLADTVLFEDSEFSSGALGMGPFQTFMSSPSKPYAYDIVFSVHKSDN